MSEMELESQTAEIRKQSQAMGMLATQRQTPKTSFDEKLKTAALSSNTMLRNAAMQAGTTVAGSSVLSTVIRSSRPVAGKNLTTGSSKLQGTAPGSTGLVSSSNSATTTTSTSSSGSDPALAATGTTGSTGSSNTSSAQLLAATNQMQEVDQDFNLQYLMLQEKMQTENRDFTSVSNVMKTKSDTAKNSLSNVK